MEVQRGAHVTIVCFGRFAFDCIHRYAPIGDERRCYIILSGKGIRRDEYRFSAAGLQCAREVGGFSCYVSTGYEPYSLERFLFTEALANQSQHGHFPFSPVNSLLALWGKANVFHVKIKRACCTHYVIILCCPVMNYSELL